jgi:hypothetical protein
MVEVTRLPDNSVLMPLVMFPIGNDTTHRFVAMKCQDGVDVIRHQHEDRDVPTPLPVVKLGGFD